MATYTIYLITRNARHHYPVIMANNGKAILNEPVKRAQDLERSVNRFLNGALWSSKDIPVIRITEKAFKAKFPKYAANKGPKKAVKVDKVWVPKPGQKFIVFQKTNTKKAIGWERQMDKLIGRPLACRFITLSGLVHCEEYAYVFHPNDIKPAPAKRITKKVTNPVK